MLTKADTPQLNLTANQTTFMDFLITPLSIFSSVYISSNQTLSTEAKNAIIPTAVIN